MAFQKYTLKVLSLFKDKKMRPLFSCFGQKQVFFFLNLQILDENQNNVQTSSSGSRRHTHHQCRSHWLRH